MRKIFLVFLAAMVLVGAVLPAGETQAFQRPPWTIMSTTNVPLTDVRFYDDFPVGTPYMVPGSAAYEAGVFMFMNNQTVDETSAAYTVNGLAISYAVPSKVLEVRAAVSDGGWLRVGLGTSTTGFCQYWPVSMAGAAANGIYQVRAIPFGIPAGTAVRKVCVWLSDSPDTIASGYTKATIDYIKIRNTGGSVFWMENFYGGP